MSFPTVALKNVCEFLDHLRKPVTESDRKPGPFPYYGANGRQDWVDSYIFDEPLILLAEDGGHFGSQDRPIAYKVTGKCWVNNHAHVLRPKPNCNVDYLHRVLSFYDVTKFISGTTRPKLTKGKAQEIAIPLPPLAEQQRIADILSRADRLRRLRRFALEMSAGYLQAVFLEMFGESFQKRHGVVLFPKVVWFQEGPGVRKWQFKSEGIKLLNVGNIVNGQLDLSNTSRFLAEDEAFGKYAHFLCEPDDIVMASSGVTWGKTAIVYPEHLPLCMNTSTIRMRPKGDNTLLRQYLRGFIESPFFVRQIEVLITGSAQPNFGPLHLKQVEIVVPEIGKQQAYSEIADRWNHLRAQQREALRQAEQLFQGLLQAAFRGEV